MKKILVIILTMIIGTFVTIVLLQAFKHDYTKPEGETNTIISEELRQIDEHVYVIN